MTRARVLTFLALGPVGWAVDLVGSFMLVPHLAVGESRQWLLLIAAVCAATAGVGALMAWRARHGEFEKPSWRFVAVVSAVLNVFFVLVIAATAIPKVILLPGE